VDDERASLVVELDVSDIQQTVDSDRSVLSRRRRSPSAQLVFLTRDGWVGVMQQAADGR
jgi:hypothetical protein